MASNEHKNLTDINRHNPKGLETALNDTVLGKTIGSSSTLTDGILFWQNKSLMGVTNYKMQGFATGASTYFYGEDISDTKSPYEMAVDYGQGTVSAGSLSPSNFFRIGQSCVVNQVSSVANINGWITSSGTDVVTIAICKVTPVADSSADVTPIVIDEITVTGLGSNNKLAQVSETTITTAELAVGDIIFPMIKESASASTIYMNLAIQTTTY
tara:strand:+ start:626 stop:1264 length:639 start_codon:yes stop_codon:yes gene_type:complete